MERLVSWIIGLVEGGYVPDAVSRYGVRYLLQQRLLEQGHGDIFKDLQSKMDFVEHVKREPIALSTIEANEQHYEIPFQFYLNTLDTKFLKYSCCYFGFEGQDVPKTLPSLEEAAQRMLDMYIQRAQIADNMEILDLGCGWGSVTLYIAQKFNNSNITALSNSTSQKEFIMSECSRRNLTNVKVITADMNHFETQKQFDRIISIEMFEHMKNYHLLLQKIATFLKPNGYLFVHIFSHVRFAYNFVPQSSSDWMSKYFFTNGTMPSDDLLLYFQKDLQIVNHWRVDGRNYGETSEQWLKNMDNNIDAIKLIFEKTYGAQNIALWIMRWRLFFIAVAEMFKMNNGQEWIVSHYLFQKSTLAKL